MNIENIAHWSRARDLAPLPSGEEYRHDWHFALQLWGVLYVLRSLTAARVYEQLLANATAPRFREALQRARAMYDTRAQS